ncbi:hypothetical protein SLH49_05455 [Cognatiyoonia sp. IB215446]|uniref:hypothetical protein n=1 Tax=Cognatiyoonia sp. IB215446 TaxID=3097355 RepID=UPI002A1670C4|nr:hypothetical protein [Cognatiyoonia sp. IB215446]MDX8347428.1 hypothetical protein [Cognatiyoonia sp. IB215446]
MPLTFRLLFHGIRSLWVAALLALIAWLTLVPASQAERAALGNDPLARTSFALSQMRIARIVVHFAPERAANLLSRASGGDISPELAGMLLRDIARNNVEEDPQFEVVETTRTTRSVGGAKFVTVD